MQSLRQSKLLKVSGKTFSISGDRTPDGNLRLAVADLDGAFPHPDDSLAEAFRDALRQRLHDVRARRASS